MANSTLEEKVILNRQLTIWQMLKHFPKEELNIYRAIGAVIMVAIGEMGISNIPTDAEILRINYFITTHYSDFTIDDIADSFEFLIIGKIKVKESSHFNNFSKIYMCSILNAFREWRKSAQKFVKASNLLPEHTEVPNEVKIAYNETFVKNLNDCIKWSIEKGDFCIFSPSYVIDFLHKNNYAAFEQSDFDKKIRSAKNRLYFKEGITPKSEGYEDKLQFECKRLVVMEFFRICNKNGTILT